MNLAMKQVWVADHVATGANVRALRNTARVSLREVARRMRVSPAFLSDLERGLRNWDADKLKRAEVAIRRTSNNADERRRSRTALSAGSVSDSGGKA